jgi:hypothetical protein
MLGDGRLGFAGRDDAEDGAVRRPARLVVEPCLRGRQSAEYLSPHGKPELGTG